MVNGKKQDVIFVPGEGFVSQAEEVSVAKAIEKVTTGGRIVGGVGSGLGGRGGGGGGSPAPVQGPVPTETTEVRPGGDAQRTTIQQVQGGPQPSTISSFDSGPSGQFFLPLPSQRALGVSQPGFLTQTFAAGRRGLRSLFNVRTAEDISPLQERGIFVGGKEDILVKARPTGTIIDTGTGIRTDTTLSERATQQAIEAGGVGPTQFVVEDIATSVVERTQTKLDSQRVKVQTQIDRGNITVVQGKRSLEASRKLLTEQAQKDFIKEVGGSEQLKKRGKLTGTLTTLRKAEKGIDVEPLVQGAVTAGALATGAPGAAAVISVGAAQIFSVPARPTREEAISTAVSGVLNVGLGAGFGLQAERAIQTAAEQSLFAGLSKQQFKQVSLQFKPGGELASKTSRQFGGLTQELTITARAVRTAEEQFLIAPGGFQSQIGGFLPRGSTVGGKKVLVSQTTIGNLGAKGTVTQLGGKQTLAVGRSTITEQASTGGRLIFPTSERQIGIETKRFAKQITSNLKITQGVQREGFGAVSKQVDKDLFFTFSGKAEPFVDVGTGQVGFNVAFRDKGITKVIKFQDPSRAIVTQTRGGSGSATELALQSFTKQQQASISSGLQQSLKEAISTPTITQARTSITGQVFRGIPRSTARTKQQGVRTTTVTGLDTRTLTTPRLSGSRQKFGSGLDLKDRNNIISGTSIVGGTPVRTKGGQATALVPKLAQSPLQSQSQITRLKQPPVPKLEALKLPTPTGRGPGGFDFPGARPGPVKFPVPFFPPFPSLGGGGLRGTGTRRRRKAPTQISTSFTGIVVGGIGLPKGGPLGISPGILRGLPGTPSTTKKKTTKKKSTKKKK